MHKEKVNFVFWSARALGHTITYTKACQVADKFTLDQLRRIYLKIKNTGRRPELRVVS